MSILREQNWPTDSVTLFSHFTVNTDILKVFFLIIDSKDQIN